MLYKGIQQNRTPLRLLPSRKTGYMVVLANQLKRPCLYGQILVCFSRLSKGMI